jgi:hypothetical protein
MSLDTSYPSICRESYIKADLIEGLVWDAVSKAIKNPEVIIAALREQIDIQSISPLKTPSHGF